MKFCRVQRDFFIIGQKFLEQLSNWTRKEYKNDEVFSNFPKNTLKEFLKAAIKKQISEKKSIERLWNTPITIYIPNNKIKQFKKISPTINNLLKDNDIKESTPPNSDFVTGKYTSVRHESADREKPYDHNQDIYNPFSDLFLEKKNFSIFSFLCLCGQSSTENDQEKKPLIKKPYKN